MIGYISVKNVDGKYVGGVLVVDDDGIPREFKYTKPVVPTKLQRIVYGKVLDRYLSVEIIAKSLLSRIENKPSVFLTDQVDLVDSADNVFYITKTVAELGENPEEGEYVIETGGVKYRLLGSSQIPEEALDELKSFGEKLSLLEPFQRLSEALEYVCSEY